MVVGGPTTRDEMPVTRRYYRRQPTPSLSSRLGYARWTKAEPWSFPACGTR